MADKKDKDTKKILQNVRFHDREYGPGDEDDLEERLTKDNYERLMKDDPPPLAGDWSPKGKAEAPMPTSPTGATPRGQRAPRPVIASMPPHQGAHAQAEFDRLKAENEKLRAEVEKHQAAERHAAERSKAAGHGGKDK